MRIPKRRAPIHTAIQTPDYLETREMGLAIWGKLPPRLAHATDLIVGLAWVSRLERIARTLTNDAVAEGWLVRGYRDARGDGTFRTATATYNTVYRRIEATKIETRERGALSPLASSKDAAPRREHENSARENTDFPSGYHQREQHRNNHRE
ncbi:PREDICTED: uncharacterized protein LOC105622569 [Atta cephalotes]|uniref:Uncharacterized protein n=1 Tax=Atta cephalotes TaxID=12957 RepID=A0A158NPB8_ATTCE|nr:PREDICTED: uncharacterized protein LOC105622569 [Atta cephalotes]